MPMRPLLFLLAVALLLCGPLQAAKDLRTKEQRLYAIKLRNAQWEVDRKKLDMETRQSEYEEIEELFDQNIGTIDQLNGALAAYQQARLAYAQDSLALEETRLSFLRDATHISIREAKKYRTADGRRQVEITIENSSELGQAMALNPHKKLEQVQALLGLQNILVSIRDPDGLIVAEPYETLVPSLRLGERQALQFRLLEDYEAVVVSLRLPDTYAEDPYIVLRRESLQDLPTLSSAQSSQEGDLNSRVRYDLILERLAEEEKTFRLAVIDLPEEIAASFVDPATEAELTQVKFSDKLSRQQLELELQIPEKLSQHYIDQTIEFYVFVVDQEGFQQLAQLKRSRGEQPLSPKELAALKGTRERFALIPRGTGRLELLVDDRFQELETSQAATFQVDLLNAGTLELARASLRLSLPAGWTCQATPETVASIAPGERETVELVLASPPGLKGEYEFRLEAAGYAGQSRVEAQEKEISVRVEPPIDRWRTGLIIGGIIALIAGVTIASVRLSRR